MRDHHTQRTWRRGAHLVILVVALFWFTFAALSGAEEGLAGLWANVPNTLPWIGLLALLGLSVRWPGAGGALIIAVAIGVLFHFHAWTNSLLLVTIVLPLLVAGAVLLISHWPILGHKR